MGDDVLRESRLCQRGGMQEKRRELAVDRGRKWKQNPGSASGGQVVAYLQGGP